LEEWLFLKEKNRKAHFEASARLPKRKTIGLVQTQQLSSSCENYHHSKAWWWQLHSSRTSFHWTDVMADGGIYRQRLEGAQPVLP